ncbi:MAG: DNA-binding protein [Spirochaetes bacterium]|jgi:predicted DNA-binding transcriptional regulator AlpA|nr:MAG: DNA-binding protein [Spirochaetota bacterium]
MAETFSTFVSSADLAAETGIPATTWRSWAQHGKGPQPVKLGGRWFWRREDVEKWIAEQERSSS